MKFAPASKKKSKLRLALIGLAGSGKSWSSLAIAEHLVPGGRIAVIDTERGSASLYADRFKFDVLELERHGPEDYCEAIEAAEQSGYDLVVIDSLSHAWAGKDGALEQVDKIAKREGKSNNFTAWRDVTPLHNRLVDSILSCRMHVIATMRSKMEYSLEKDEKGKSSVRKVGLAPIQREGLDFEFTIVGDLNLDHQLVISKSRCSAIGVGDLIDKPGEKFAVKIREWLNSGEAPVERPLAPSSLDVALDATFTAYLDALAGAKTLAELDAHATGPSKPVKGSKNYETAKAAYLENKTRIETAMAQADALARANAAHDAERAKAGGR